MNLSLVIVDLAEISRKGLTAFLRSYEGFQVLAEAKSIGEATEICRTRKPDIVLIRTEAVSDEQRRGMAELRGAYPDVNIFVITSKVEQDDAIAVLKAGARGLMTTDTDTQTLLAAIRSVAKGEVALSRGAMIHLVDSLSFGSNGAEPKPVNRSVRSRPKLTAREAEVLVLVSRGASNRIIADSLVISEHTVRAHLRNILDKLRVENRIQAATWATRFGLDNGTPPQSVLLNLNETNAAGANLV